MSGNDDHKRHLSDEALSEAIREMFCRADPVPRSLAQAGREALRWRTVDEELAKLLGDDLMTPRPHLLLGSQCSTRRA
jgi:hypothetical protein